MMAPATAQGQRDAHLARLADGVKQLRARKADKKTLNRMVLEWSKAGMPKLTLMDEIEPHRGEQSGASGQFSLNKVVTYVYARQNQGMVAKGEFFNSTEQGVYYSAIEKTVAARQTVSYAIAGHRGPQEFFIVSYEAAAPYTATIGGKGVADLGQGVKTASLPAVGSDQTITLTITNSADHPVSFVILNHNPQK